MSSLPTKACWETEDARIILATEALERDDSVFLATHSPIENFKISGAHSADIETPNEKGLIDALSDQTLDHAFCVVEGDPGSGKSHLIRWLQVMWPKDEELKPLLIQRLDGSLQGTLSQLRNVLPKEHQHLFDMLGRPQDLTLTGRARVFHTNLALALHPDHFANPPEDAKWCEQFKLASLLSDPALLDEWKAPERIIELLSGKKGKRDQELARFNLTDIAELETLIRPLKAPSPKSVRFKNELKKEAEEIRLLNQQELRNSNTQDDLRLRFDFSYKLVDALNERHNHAVQSVLGISTDGLKELFLRLRKELKNTRLVLLLEDITAWEGVDRQLIDVLVTNVATREESDLCPMISVVGLTPVYFQNRSFQANYRQRITHHIQLGESEGTDNLHPTTTLQSWDSQLRFAARYLRATRTGIGKLKDWAGGPDPIPNSCETCQHQMLCHMEFGHYDGIGLFPFTENSVKNLFRILTDPQHTDTFQTPRGMIQGVLSPTLLHPDLLEANEYPSAEIETELIPEDEKHLFGPIKDILIAQIDDDRERERVRRLITYWRTDDSVASITTADSDGSLIFSGVRKGVYQAFGLPWLGEENAEETQRETSQTDTSDSSSTDTSSEQSDATSKSSSRSSKASHTSKPKMSNAQLTATRLDIARWKNSKKPKKPYELNKLAYEIVSQLNWEFLGISNWLASRLFTQDTVILRDTKPARHQHFVLEREPWVYHGIEAYQALRIGTEGLQSIEIERYHQQFATMLYKLNDLVKIKAKDRLPVEKSDEPWDFVSVLSQILLVRAWLRGDTSPKSSSWEQWQAIISEEDLPSSNPQDRVDSWGELVNSTKGIQSSFRALLRQSLNLPKYQPETVNENPNTSIARIDKSLCNSLSILQKAFKISPIPEQIGILGDSLQEIKRVSDVATVINSKLSHIPRYEVERLNRMAIEVDKLSRKNSLREHVKRVDGLIEELVDHFPTVHTQEAQKWSSAKDELEREGFLSTETPNPGDTIEKFIDLIEDEGLPLLNDKAGALSWSIEAPAKELCMIYEAFETAEDVVEFFHEYVSAYLEGTSNSPGTIGDVHKAGNKIRIAAENALVSLRDNQDD